MEFKVSESRVELWGGELSLKLNGLFKSDGTNQVVDGKAFQSVYIVLPFIVVLVDKLTIHEGFEEFA